jgi:predicted  nucleic acid-binding Zn-ribbon protein
MVAFVKDAQIKIVNLEKSAKNLYDEYKEVTLEYEKNFKKIKALTSSDLDKANDNKLNSNLELVNQFSSDLFSLERKLNNIISSINTTLKEFETTKNNVIIARKKHAESKNKLSEIEKEYEPKIKELKTKLNKLEAKVNPAIMQKYKNYKKDNIFPVFVSLNDKRCGYCRFELPSGKIDKLKNEDFITCEQCGRLIFKQ